MKNRRIATLCVALIAALTVSACSLLNRSTPTATLKAFYEASKKKDATAMKKTLSKGSLDMFEKQAKEQGKSFDDLLKSDQHTPDKMPETRNEKIDGETATLEVKNDQTNNWDTLPFVKEDGEWKIAFDKFIDEMMKGLGEPKIK